MGVTTYTINQANKAVRDKFSTDLSHMATGDDATTPTVSDTTLGNETIRESFFSETTKTNSTLFLEMFQDTTENNGNTIAEMGTFTASSGGDMYNRALTNTISKDSTTNVFITCKYVFNTKNPST